MASNQSVYGLTVRARALGLDGLTEPRGLAIASVYGLLVLAFAAFAGWQSTFAVSDPAGRSRLVVTAIGLLALASFRSPFVGGIYGLVGTVWLLTLLASRARTERSFLGGLGLTALFCAASWLIPGPGHDPTSIAMWVSGIVFVVAVCANVFAVARSRHSSQEMAGAVEISTRC
jgi:hypothetical protein